MNQTRYFAEGTTFCLVLNKNSIIDTWHYLVGAFQMEVK
jgi:hypothetical protein